MREENIPQSDDPLYRDYLLSVIDEWITREVYYVERGDQEIFTKQPKKQPSTAQQIRQKTLEGLKKRFKQDFSTQENVAFGANRVAIEVIGAVLTEDLGMEAGALPAWGGQHDQVYLQGLIALSNQSKEALERLYFIDLSRPDRLKTTRVRENIRTLLTYLRDEEFSKYPNPFFLYKEEWRQRFQQPFYPENHYAFRTALFANSTSRNNAKALLNAVQKHKDYPVMPGATTQFVERVKRLLSLDQLLLEGHNYAGQEHIRLAENKYISARNEVEAIVGLMWMGIYTKDSRHYTVTPELKSALGFRITLDPNFSGMLADIQIPVTAPGKGPIDLAHGKVPSTFPYTTTLLSQLQKRYDGRASLNVEKQAELDILEASNMVDLPTPVGEESYSGFLAGDDYSKLENALFDLHDDLISLVPHVYFLLLPICLGDVAAAMGQYPQAAYWYAQAARECLLRASISTDTPDTKAPSEAKGDLPWNWWNTDFTQKLNFGTDYPYLNQDVEKPFILLRLGALYLVWADQLYRTDRQAEIYRARELYKGVLRQYGIDPLPDVKLAPLPLKLDMRARDWIRGTPGTLLEEAPAGLELNVAGPAPAPGPAMTFEMIEIPAFGIAAPRVRRDGALIKRMQQKVSAMEAEIKNLSDETRNAWALIASMGVSPGFAAQPAASGALLSMSGAWFGAVIFMPVNPAILAQQTRANLGFQSINSGLNYFGYPDDLVPFLRYKPLVGSAKHFSQLAKQAEQDFLAYKSNAGQAELAAMQLENSLANTLVRVEIESQRIYEANDYVLLAQGQVADVEKSIQDKKDEIADHDSVCGQVKDYFSGIGSFFGIVPSGATSYIKSDFASAFGVGGSSGGAMAGAGVVGGMALFAIGTGVTLDGMAEAANQRVEDLQALQNHTLPLAKAALDARQRQLAIAQLQKSAAFFDALYARDVLTYLQLREFNAERWNQMAAFIKTTLRRYLELGAMTGWLAERALSYEQDRNLRIIRFDYFQASQQGVLGVDALQSDLATLEKEYLEGYQHTLPVKWTVSLAHDFPLEFGQLKKNGVCSFITRRDWLEQAYPGMYNHRIRTLEIYAVVPLTETPPRGILTNNGISMASDYQPGSSHEIVRQPDVLPLSEFVLKDGMALYQLPGDGLLPFEGSGVDTLWRLKLPAAANPSGLAALADVAIVFHLSVNISLARQEQAPAAAEKAQAAIFSARFLFPKSLADFQAGGDQAALEFEIISNLLPGTTRNRKVRNVAVYFIGEDLPEINATLTAPGAQAGAHFTTQERLAHSNQLGAPAAFASPAAALDALANGGVEGKWALQILAAENPNLVRQDVQDVFLGVEYTAQISYL